MFKTKVTEMLGIKYPLIAGTMMYITTPDFVAACSEAGGLGVLASALFDEKEKFRRGIRRIRELTDKPFAVNINLFPMMRPVDNNDYTDVLVEEGVKIVETSGHSAPEGLCRRFKDAGMTWIHKCVGLRYALKVQDMGADAVTLVGYENGGATGKLDVGTLVLVRRAVETIKLPVIGGGGVADGRGVLALLALGTSGVIMGTRLLATKECPIHQHLKEALVQASELDTMLIMRSMDATHRVWANAAAKKAYEIETKGGEMQELLSVVAGVNAKRMYEEGDVGAGVVSCGQGVGLVHDIPSVKELFDRLMQEAGETARGLCSNFGC